MSEQERKDRWKIISTKRGHDSFKNIVDPNLDVEVYMEKLLNDPSRSVEAEDLVSQLEAENTRIINDYETNIKPHKNKYEFIM